MSTPDYEHFAPAVPDAATQEIVALADSARANLISIRDSVLLGEVPDWTVTPTYDETITSRILSIVASNGAERLRRAYTYATGGPDEGRLTRVDTDWSNDGGATWQPVSSTTITYHADGRIAGRAPT